MKCGKEFFAELPVSLRLVKFG